jgi:methionine-rich copper-binding protein CopC
MRVVHVHPSHLLPRVPRGAVVALAATGSLALGAAVADAHAQLRSTSPSASGTASTRIRSVSVTFNQEPLRGTLVVKHGRTVVSVGRGGKDPSRVTRLKVALKRGLKAGRYTATWTVEAVDGHEQKGTFTFRLKQR